MKAMVRIQKRRQENEQKDTLFRVRSRPVDPDKLARFVKRQKNREHKDSPHAEDPLGEELLPKMLGASSNRRSQQH